MSFYIDAIEVGNTLQNYIWMIVDTREKQAVAIDPTQANLVLDYCQAHQLTLQQIWITHKHHDHIGGVDELKQKTQAKVFAPFAEKQYIPTCDEYVENNNVFYFKDLKVDVIATPGHTLGHVCYFIDKIDALFSGDTLFAMGCGRLFEGSYEQMYHSLCQLAALPAYTKVYCTHEYTESNATFAITIEPDNYALKQRYQEVKELRKQSKITLPSTIELELKTNPFLRSQSIADFQRIRQLKDQF